jgi:hypothetical protein
LTARIYAGCRSSSANECWPSWCAQIPSRHALNEYYIGDADIVYQQACKLGCEGIVSKTARLEYRSGPSTQWLKVKNPAAPAVRR